MEFVIIPQLSNTIKYILSELDELEREDTYRIKKVKDMRQKIADEEEAEKKKAIQDFGDSGVSNDNILGAGRDEDDVTGDFD